MTGHGWVLRNEYTTRRGMALLGSAGHGVARRGKAGFYERQEPTSGLLESPEGRQEQVQASGVSESARGSESAKRRDVSVLRDSSGARSAPLEYALPARRRRNGKRSNLVVLGVSLPRNRHSEDHQERNHPPYGLLIPEKEHSKMRTYRIHITGEQPGILMHCGRNGLDTRSEWSIEIAEITKKRGPRTDPEEERVRELECLRSLWLHEGVPTIPGTALRKMIETSARKLKQGPLVRESLLVLPDIRFSFDPKHGSCLAEWGKQAQHQAPVVVGQARLIRTRALFENWGCRFSVEVDEEMIEESHLRTWLNIGGRRIGLGDWRPEKSGAHGRFQVAEVTN